LRSIHVTPDPITVPPSPASLLSVPPITAPLFPYTTLFRSVTALDQFGNTDTNYGGTVHFTKSDAGTGSAVPADYAFVAADHGTHDRKSTRPNASHLVQSYAATGTINNITGTQDHITVTPAP